MQIPTRTIKPSQRCPKCGAVHKDWAELGNRYHVCSACGFEIERDRGSAMVMYNVATNQQSGLGASLVSLGCFSSTSETCYTGSMKQLGQWKTRSRIGGTTTNQQVRVFQKKRQKSRRQADGETPSAYAVG